ncbi:glycosyltransferase [Microbacterium sp. NIBRBAC000506063]|uniref:glycosyltransferase n=1 Tax=Microbacterium sp. NIBRBAC000506063 TaxID=2734618 RepID=UPI001BB4FE3E|nr:glycosyltransferase [Microbacterium sp. NIBRBAC000506063]QTV80391.1 glycosyltransferase [Microbacterium sp. NIBRBAC000506063]
MTIDITIVSWVIGAIVMYYGLLFLASLVRPRQPRSRSAAPPLMVLLIPARNEELVLEGTLSAMSRLRYSGDYRVLVVDDASEDATGEIAARWAATDARIRLSRRVLPEAAQGKSEVLNHCYRLLERWIAEGDPWMGGRRRDEVVLVIVDADGRLEKDALEKVAPFFDDARVGSVQIGVRIANARDNLLARMQDIEFVGFSCLVQIARDWIGSSGLGGNGQFTRLAALASIDRGAAGGDGPWSRGALTEDLDLGLWLVRAGWRTRFCYATFVAQQGLTEWKPLIRQRTRWIQGHYQCWRHIGGLAAAGRVRLATRFDLILYLVLVVTVLLVSATMGVALLGAVGVVDVVNDFLVFVPYGIPRRLASVALSLLPVVVFMGTYQVNSRHPFRWWEVPAAGVAFTAYSYAWLWVSLKAIVNIARGRNTWVKTPRVAAAPPQREVAVPARR